MKKYSKDEKIAYYKKLAKQNGSKMTVSGKGKYVVGRPNVRGRGRYSIPKNFFNAPKLGSMIGGMIGNSIAPGIGGALGGELGSAGGKLFKSITGFGDYTVRDNSLVYPDRVVPSFGEDSIRVKKREYIADINGTTAFTNNTFPVNPGLSEVFPWLSQIANNYEQYRWNGLIFQFVSTSSDAIASTTDLGLGQVILASDYNSADAAFVNAPQMLGTMFSNSGKPSENIMHAIECAPTDVANKLYYVRSGDVPSGTDIRLYDMLSFQLATQKMPANYDGMGQLWVSYDVTLCKSVQNNQLGFSLNTDQYFLVAPAVTTAYFGTSRTLRDNSNLGTTVTGTQIRFPVTLSSGYYLVYYHMAGSSTAVANPSLVGTNCTLIQGWSDTSLSGISNGSTTSGNFIATYIVRIDDRDAVLTYSGGTLCTSPTVGNLIITQINGEIFL